MGQYSVFTIGHGETAWHDFAYALRLNAVELLVDVRAWPYSECAPWFDRERIERGARSEGMEYLWLGAQLGALTADGRADFIAREREPRYREGINELLSLAQDRRACLVSSQPDPFASHRHQLIAQTLMRHDVEVLHILPGGQLAHAVADLFHAGL